MNTNIKKKAFSEKILITAYVIFILKNMLDSSALFHRPQIIDTVLIFAFLLCVGYKLLTQVYSKGGLLLLCTIGVICVYSSMTMKYFSLLSSFLCICALQDVDIKKLLRVSACTKVIMISIHVIAYIITFIMRPEVITFVYRNGVKRHFFFLGHANLFTAYLAWTCMEIIYVHYKNMKTWQFIGIWLINIIFYQFTDSNTGTLVLTAIILLAVIEKRRWSVFEKWLQVLSKYSFAICSVFFPFIVVIYTRLNGKLLMLWEGFNIGLTGRLLYGAYAYDTYGFTIIGRRISFPSKVLWRGHWIDTIIFDNSYLWLFISFGIIHLMILSIAFFLIGKRASNMERILIIAFTFYGIMEAYVVNAFICFPLLFIGKYIYERKQIDKKEKRQVEDQHGNETKYNYSGI